MLEKTEKRLCRLTCLLVLAWMLAVSAGLVYGLIRLGGPFLDALDRGEPWATWLAIGFFGVVFLFVLFERRKG